MLLSPLLFFLSCGSGQTNLLVLQLPHPLRGMIVSLLSSSERVGPVAGGLGLGFQFALRS